MKMNFTQVFNNLKLNYNKFDLENIEQKKRDLENIKSLNLPKTKQLIDYQNLLLFLIAHPSDTETLQFVETELNRLASTLKKYSTAQKSIFDNSGLPFTTTISTFSHDSLKYLSNYHEIEIKLDSFYNSTAKLSDVLQFTLPTIEKEIVTISTNNNSLLKSLKIKKDKNLDFILNEFDKLDNTPFIKDYLFNSVGIYVKIIPRSNQFSKIYNKVAVDKVYFHNDIIKQFDQLELLNRNLPKHKKFNKEEEKRIISVVKNSLALLQRETDPVTYMNVKSFRYFELERGISIAIYGITADRQLPLESYVGYTLFKNGFPAAYGGSWVLGKRALFGINIFESFRGGESGYMMCQLLRVYRKVFDVDYFEVEPYQYGLGNPEGISSGAFWFYYRFGFRLLDKRLDEVSSAEFEKIKTIKGYRTSKQILQQFTKSNIALNMGKEVPINMESIRNKVTNFISEKFNGNRAEAEKTVIDDFLKKMNKRFSKNDEQKKIFSEFAFLSEVLKSNSRKKDNLIYQAALIKNSDLYEYQKIMKKIFD